MNVGSLFSFNRLEFHFKTQLTTQTASFNPSRVDIPKTFSNEKGCFRILQVFSAYLESKNTRWSAQGKNELKNWQNYFQSVWEDIMITEKTMH